jgi:hypothetical protein
MDYFAVRALQLLLPPFSLDLRSGSPRARTCARGGREACFRLDFQPRRSFVVTFSRFHKRVPRVSDSARDDARENVIRRLVVYLLGFGGLMLRFGGRTA